MGIKAQSKLLFEQTRHMTTLISLKPDELMILQLTVYITNKTIHKLMRFMNKYSSSIKINKRLYYLEKLDEIAYMVEN